MKQLVISAFFLFCSYFAFSQVTDSTAAPVDSIPKATAADTTTAPPPKQGRSFNEKFALGFGAGFWVNSRETYFEVSPSLAYRFPKRLITGIGYRYIYRHDKDRNNDLHSYGPNIFARVNLTKRIYFWTEYEYLNTQYFVDKGINYNNDYTRETTDTDSWFVGLGFQQSLGRKDRGGISMQFLYNILYDDDDLYNPYYSAYTYRIGYFF